MRFVATILFLLVFGVATAQSPSPATIREIDQLLVALETSPCQFNRNGAWYSAQEAAEHLRRKYGYLLRKHLVTSAESFIELAGAKSSMSGKPYLVRCGNAQPVPSKAWFAGKLKELRARPADANSSSKSTSARGAARSRR